MNEPIKDQIKKRRLEIQLVEKISRLAIVIGGVLILLIWASRFL